MSLWNSCRVCRVGQLFKFFVRNPEKFLKRTYSSISVRDILLTEDCVGKQVTVKGWIQSRREHKDVTFLNLSDGSCLKLLQAVARTENVPKDANFGSCVEIEGIMVASPGPSQPTEMQAERITVWGPCDGLEYPIKYKKHHAKEILRQKPHYRVRTNFGASMLRIRSEASKAIHDFFHNNSFVQIHTPVLTSNDCEGAGEVFQVKPAAEAIVEEKDEAGNVKEFFNTQVYLTVSGQLHLEAAAGAMQRVYTFSPTFRAESSRGRNHLAEFHMVEAEVAFVTSLSDLMETMEALIKNTTERVLQHCPDEMSQFHKRWGEAPKHEETVNNVATKEFSRLQYSEAMEILEKNNEKFQCPVKWGDDLFKEHEKFLVSHCGNTPVFVTDYPMELKPFYCRVNDDGKTGAAVDLLGPWVGELCGGSLREERLDVLQPRVEQLQLQDRLGWYLDLRRFGSCPHGGFGVGFDRLVQMLLGVNHIRDATPFPRARWVCKL